MALSDEGRMVADVARRLLEDVPMSIYLDVEAGRWPDQLWAQIEAAGLPLALVGEEAGGFGLPLADGLELVRLTGALASPVPLAETMLANWMLARAGLPVEAGPVAFTDAALNVTGDRLFGKLADVSWGRRCALVAPACGQDGDLLVRIAAGGEATHAANIAGEPRDGLAIDVLLADTAFAPIPFPVVQVRAIGAALRALQLAGAIETVMAMTLDFVQARKQFGRTLGGFQAIQHQVAQLAGETAATRVAGDLAAEALSNGLDAAAVATAKIRTGEAAGRMAAAAHQLHGAMGFTQEHRLHLFTRRLWAWRDEFGGEAEWSAVLGRQLAPAGGDVWRALTRI